VNFSVRRRGRHAAPPDPASARGTQAMLSAARSAVLDPSRDTNP